MHIERFDLKAFGRFSDASIDFGGEPGKLHIVYGPNESGKSTSLRAITAWLFGIDNRCTDNYVHAYADLRIGGKLRSDRVGELEYVRRKGSKRTLKTIDESSDVEESLLSRMLGGMDQETFLRGFGLDRQRLIEGGRDIMCGEGDLGQILFSAGVGMRGLNEIVASLEKEKRALFLPTGQVPELNKTLAELKKLKSELATQTLSAAELQRRGKQLDEAKELAEAIAQRRLDAQRNLSRAESFQKAMPLAARRELLLSRLQELKAVPLIDDNFRQSRRGADADLQIANGQLKLLNDRLENLQAQIADIPAQHTILQFAERIEQLSEMAIVCQDAEVKLPELGDQAKRLRDELQDLMRQLGRTPDADVQSLGPSEEAKLEIQQLMDESLRLDELRKSKRQTLTEIIAELGRIQNELKDESPQEPLGLAAVLKAYTNPQRLVEDRGKAEAEVARLDKKMETAFRKLSGFGGTVEEAQQLRLPLAAKVQQLGEKHASTEKMVNSLRDTCQKLRSELDDLRRQLLEEDNSSSVPTEHDLVMVREDRNRAFEALSETRVTQLETSTLAEQVAQLRLLVQQSDQVVDAMRAAADVVARRVQAKAHLQKISDSLVESENALEDAIKQADAASEQWIGLWRDAGVEASTPQEMTQWLNKYELFSDVAEHHLASIANLKTIDAEVADALVALRNEVEEAGAEGSPDKAIQDNLLVLHARASQAYDASMLAFKSAEQLAREDKRLQTERKKVEQEILRLETEWDQWETRWQTAVKDVATDISCTPPEVRQMLSTMDAAIDAHARLIACERQIVEIENRSQHMKALVRELADEIDDEASEDFLPQKILGTWRLAVQHAGMAEKERKNLGNQRDECLLEIKTCQAKANAGLSVLEVLCREVGCESADQLPALEQRAGDKRELTQELTQVENGLLALAGGEDLTSFCQQTLASEAAELAEIIGKNQGELDRSQSSWETAQQEVGALQRAYDEMDGSGRAAEISQQMQSLEAKAAKLARRYGELAIQQAVLNRAIEDYRDRNQGPVLQRASQIFERITNGRYRTLKPYLDDKNQRILIGVRVAGNGVEGNKETEVRANLMSEGTADALFLALRLAGLETHVHEHAAVPLVMDDVLVQFDDNRCVEALRVLCEVSQLTQVIFFTHHQHLVELVEENLQPEQYKVHWLERLGS